MKKSLPSTKFSTPVTPLGWGDFSPTPLMLFWKTSPKRGVEIISKYFIVRLWTATQLNTSKNEMSLKVLLVIWDGFLISPGNTEYEFWRMKVFSILHIEKGVDYSSIQNFLWVCLFVSLSLLDKCKRMTQVHPHFPTILKTDQQWA